MNGLMTHPSTVRQAHGSKGERFFLFMEKGKKTFGLQCLYNYGPINNFNGFMLDEPIRVIYFDLKSSKAAPLNVCPFSKALCREVMRRRRGKS